MAVGKSVNINSVCLNYYFPDCLRNSASINITERQEQLLNLNLFTCHTVADPQAPHADQILVF